MPEESPNHGQMTIIELQAIDPSPYQLRKYFDEDKLKELAASILREGLIEPIVVRPKKDRYELIAGERQFRAVRDFTEMKTIPAQIVKATDLEVRSISAAENIQRENLSAIETIEAIVAIVDAELIEDKQYAATGKKPADRMKTLLGKLHSMAIRLTQNGTLGHDTLACQIPQGISGLRQFFAEKTLRQASGGYPVELKMFECLVHVQAGGLSYPWKSDDSVLTG